MARPPLAQLEGGARGPPPAPPCDFSVPLPKESTVPRATISRSVARDGKFVGECPHDLDNTHYRR